VLKRFYSWTSSTRYVVVCGQSRPSSLHRTPSSLKVSSGMPRALGNFFDVGQV